MAIDTTTERAGSTEPREPYALTLSPGQASLAQAFHHALIHSGTHLLAERPLRAAIEKQKGWTSDVDARSTDLELASCRVLAALAPALIGRVLSERPIAWTKDGGWEPYKAALRAVFTEAGIADDVLPL